MYSKILVGDLAVGIRYESDEGSNIRREAGPLTVKL